MVKGIDFKLKYPVVRKEEKGFCAYRAGHMYGCFEKAKPNKSYKYLKALKGEKKIIIIKKFLEGYHYQVLRNVYAHLPEFDMPAHACDCICSIECWDDLLGELAP